MGCGTSDGGVRDSRAEQEVGTLANCANSLRIRAVPDLLREHRVVRLDLIDAELPSVAALEAAIDLWLTIDIALVRSKSLVLADLLIDQVRRQCGGFGLELASPEDPATRGSQVSFRHPNAYGLVRALAEVGVVGDHRPPDIARFGLTPLYTRYVDMWDAAEKLSEVLRQRTYLAPRFAVKAGVP